MWPDAVVYSLVTDLPWPQVQHHKCIADLYRHHPATLLPRNMVYKTPTGLLYWQKSLEFRIQVSSRAKQSVTAFPVASALSARIWSNSERIISEILWKYNISQSTYIIHREYAWNTQMFLKTDKHKSNHFSTIHLSLLCCNQISVPQSKHQTLHITQYFYWSRSAFLKTSNTQCPILTTLKHQDSWTKIGLSIMNIRQNRLDMCICS